MSACAAEGSEVDESARMRKGTNAVETSRRSVRNANRWFIRIVYQTVSVPQQSIKIAMTWRNDYSRLRYKMHATMGD
jgi:hypothetical protein